METKRSSDEIWMAVFHWVLTLVPSLAVIAVYFGLEAAQPQFGQIAVFIQGIVLLGAVGAFAYMFIRLVTHHEVIVTYRMLGWIPWVTLFALLVFSVWHFIVAYQVTLTVIVLAAFIIVARYLIIGAKRHRVDQ